jgi:hypothetical protein
MLSLVVKQYFGQFKKDGNSPQIFKKWRLFAK